MAVRPYAVDTMDAQAGATARFAVKDGARLSAAPNLLAPPTYNHRESFCHHAQIQISLMPRASWVDDANAALLTDLYQLTMLQAYFREGMDEEAVFDLFVRRLKHRNYLIACGLDDALHYLEHLHFTEEALDYVRSLDQFDDAFVDYLRDFRFTGDVYAVREGTPVFANEPILEVVAPIAQAQLVETFLLNQVTYQTAVASKARRVVDVAGEAVVVDFGARRVHGTDAAMKAARASYLAGAQGTSNVLAGQAYSIPVIGTMAHSYVEAHDTERDAFEAFASLYPGTTLLVDTYDTLAGVEQVIELVETRGIEVGAIRLDSGDLGALARESRRLLDDAGLEDVRIFASGSLDEHAVAELLDQGAPIDGFGVGTRMGTVSDHPALDSAYKLSSYAGTGRMKLSSSKSNLPGRKQLFRASDEDGIAVRDVIAGHDEDIDGEPLLECVMRGGERTDAGRRSLEDAREHAAASMDRLPDRLRRPDEADPYPVAPSDALQQAADKLRARLEGDVG